MVDIENVIVDCLINSVKFGSYENSSYNFLKEYLLPSESLAFASLQFEDLHAYFVLLRSLNI